MKVGWNMQDQKWDTWRVCWSYNKTEWAIFAFGCDCMSLCCIDLCCHLSFCVQALKASSYTLVLYNKVLIAFAPHNNVCRAAWRQLATCKQNVKKESTINKSSAEGLPQTQTLRLYFISVQVALPWVWQAAACIKGSGIRRRRRNSNLWNVSWPSRTFCSQVAGRWLQGRLARPNTLTTLGDEALSQKCIYHRLLKSCHHF